MERAVDASGGQNMKPRLEALQRTSLQRLSAALLTFEVDEDAARTVLERKEHWTGSTTGRTTTAAWGRACPRF